MSSDQYQKEILYRKAKGKSLFNRYAKKILDLVDVEIKSIPFLSVEGSDNVIYDFNKGGYIELMSEGTIGEEAVRDEIRFLKEMKNRSFYIFIDDDWMYCGAFVMASSDMIRDDFVFGREILNDIILISTDMSDQISFDCYEMDGKRCIDVKKIKNKLKI